MERPQAILFGVDGTLVETGGAGGESWRRAFRDLYDVDADVRRPWQAPPATIPRPIFTRPGRNTFWRRSRSSSRESPGH